MKLARGTMMGDPGLLAPDTVLSTSDPGDDTGSRYRYQYTFAAIACCMMLDPTEDVVEVFCEHHEDILLKHADMRFTGIQIKTRETDAVWKANDEPVLLACRRFVRLDAQFPGLFRGFRFLTNHPLYAARNGNDLTHVLDAIGSAKSAADLHRPASRFLARVAAAAGCSPEVAFAALSKTRANDQLPKLADIEARLVSTLCQVWNRARDCSYTALVRAARSLTSLCARSSSLAHKGALPGYLPCASASEASESAANINGKRIGKSRLLRTLTDGLNATAVLDCDPSVYAEPGVGTADLLLKKLDAGGFSAVSRNSAQDLRDKADYLGLVWIKKHGRDSGLQRYTHVRSLVLSDAATAYEATKTNTAPFGPQMLSALRRNFRHRRAQRDQLYDCSDAHLEGFAYSLTSECKVVWSRDRPWEVK